MVRRLQFSNECFRSDRVRKQEESIRTLYSQRRHTLCDISVPGMPALLSATDLLLRVEPASSKKRRFAFVTYRND